MNEMVHRLRAAINARDLDGFVACFADDYRSDQPAHPTRAFVGASQVRQNWASVFAGLPDLTAELLSEAKTDDGVEMSEWFWHGTHLDGQPFAMRGVIVLGVEGEGIQWGRLYMESVDEGGADIDQMVADTYRPPPRS
jgi:ketosteroid isomerase-like protein